MIGFVPAKPRDPCGRDRTQRARGQQHSPLPPINNLRRRPSNQRSFIPNNQSTTTIPLSCQHRELVDNIVANSIENAVILPSYANSLLRFSSAASPTRARHLPPRNSNSLTINRHRNTSDRMSSCESPGGN